MTLAEHLTACNVDSRPYGKSTIGVMVFERDFAFHCDYKRLWRLSDYVVSSAVGGLAVVLIPKVYNDIELV